MANPERDPSPDADLLCAARLDAPPRVAVSRCRTNRICENIND